MTAVGGTAKVESAGVTTSAAHEDPAAVRTTKAYGVIWKKLKNAADYFSGIQGELPYSDRDQKAFAGYVNILRNAVMHDGKPDSRIVLCSPAIRTKILELVQAATPNSVRSDEKDEYNAREWARIGRDLLNALQNEAPPSCCVIL